MNLQSKVETEKFAYQKRVVCLLCEFQTMTFHFISLNKPEKYHEYLQIMI